MKPKLIPVKYGRCLYKKIKPRIVEIPGRFDVKRVNPQMEYSLHTEYSFGKSKFDSPIFNRLRILKDASYNGIPLLWYNEMWSREFFQFITHLVGQNQPPKVIEIHPPFRDYCSNIDIFLKRYSIFEELINEEYPESAIVIENRSGSRYTKSGFLVSNASDIANLLQRVKKDKYKLKVVLDIPALFKALGGIEYLNLEQLKDIFQMFEKNKESIAGIHVWGRDGRAHIGNLDSLFNFDIEFKESFLAFLSDYFNDDVLRYLVPEVNSGQEDFDSIISDLSRYFEFV